MIEYALSCDTQYPFILEIYKQAVSPHRVAVLYMTYMANAAGLFSCQGCQRNNMPICLAVVELFETFNVESNSKPHSDVALSA